MIPGMGAVNSKQLIAYCGSAEAVFKQKRSHLLKIPGIGFKTAASILNASVFQRVHLELEFCLENEVEIIPYNVKAFPKRLLHCHDSPSVLYKKGKLDLNSSKVLAIVGTRKASKIGLDFVQEFVEEIAPFNIQIVSGMALGIDARAHQAALAYDTDTIGVLGHSLSTIYPHKNTNLAKEMLQKGSALLSEYPSDTEIIPANFPMRNRIVAGLSDATIVVESASKGGALITANLAHSYNRDVFAVPGRYSDKYARGCNRLIKDLKANLIESAEDVLNQMAWCDQDNKLRKVQRSLALDLSEEEKRVVESLRQAEFVEMDQLLQLTNMKPGKLSNILLELELRGVVYALPGNRFSLN